MLASNGSGSRFALARAFVELMDPQELADEVIALLHRSPQPEVVSETLVALRDLGDAGRPALERLARDSDGNLRGQAFRALSPAVNEDDVPLLIDGLADSEFGVRWAAATALAAVGDAAVRPLLRALTVRPPSRSFHRAARQALSHLLLGEDAGSAGLIASLNRSTTVYESGALAFQLLRRAEARATGGEVTA